MKEYIRSELQQRATMEFLQAQSDITITPLPEAPKVVIPLVEDVNITTPEVEVMEPEVVMPDVQG